MGSGISVGGGSAYIEQSALNLEGRGLLAAASVRYVSSTLSAVRPYGELGIKSAVRKLHLTRTYDLNGGREVEAGSSTDAASAGVYFLGGLILSPDNYNTIVISGGFSRDWSSIDAAREAFSTDNLFAASLGSSKQRIDTVSGSVSWERELVHDLDFAIDLGAGYAMPSGNINGDVVFAGEFQAVGRDIAFVTYGARLNYRPTSGLDAGVFLQGVSTQSGNLVPAYGGSLTARF